MNATPVEMQTEDDKMTAEQWVKMNPRQQARWKKDHPEFSATDLLDDGSDDFGNPIMESIRSLRRK